MIVARQETLDDEVNLSESATLYEYVYNADSVESGDSSTVSAMKSNTRYNLTSIVQLSSYYTITYCYLDKFDDGSYRFSLALNFNQDTADTFTLFNSSDFTASSRVVWFIHEQLNSEILYTESGGNTYLYVPSSLGFTSNEILVNCEIPASAGITFTFPSASSTNTSTISRDTNGGYELTYDYSYAANCARAMSSQYVVFTKLNITTRTYDKQYLKVSYSIVPCLNNLSAYSPYIAIVPSDLYVSNSLHMSVLTATTDKFFWMYVPTRGLVFLPTEDMTMTQTTVYEGEIVLIIPETATAELTYGLEDHIVLSTAPKIPFPQFNRKRDSREERLQKGAAVMKMLNLNKNSQSSDHHPIPDYSQLIKLYNNIMPLPINGLGRVIKNIYDGLEITLKQLLLGVEVNIDYELDTTIEEINGILESITLPLLYDPLLEQPERLQVGSGIVGTERSIYNAAVIRAIHHNIYLHIVANIGDDDTVYGIHFKCFIPNVWFPVLSYSNESPKIDTIIKDWAFEKRA